MAAFLERIATNFDFHALRGFKPTRYSVHVNDRGALV
jgi:hypothetical protein